ncbi:TPA: PHD and RING finger domain-containing protein 1 [Trebouxia sp. C0005]
MAVTNFDALRCSKCGQTDPEEDFLLCDGCVRGFHAHCLNQDMPDSRFWFCPICAGTTIKGCLIKALESAGHIGLTAAELNAQVLLMRTSDSDEPCLSPEIVAMHNKTTVTERSRLCRGAMGRLEDGRPLVEKVPPSPTSLARFRLAPEYPSLALLSALPVEAPQLQPEVIDLLSDSQDSEAASESAEVDMNGAGFDPEVATESPEGAEAGSAEARPDSKEARSVSPNAGPDSTDTRIDSAHPGDFEAKCSLQTDMVLHQTPASKTAAALHATAAAAAQQSTSMIELWPCSASDPLPLGPAATRGIPDFPLPTLPKPPTLPEEFSTVCPAASLPASPAASLALFPAAPPAAPPFALPPPALAPSSAAPPLASSAATLATPPRSLSADSPPVTKGSADPGSASLKQQPSEAIVQASVPVKSQGTLLGVDNLMAMSPTAPSGRGCHSRAPLSLRLSPVSDLCSRLNDEEAEHQMSYLLQQQTAAAHLQQLAMDMLLLFVKIRMHTCKTRADSELIIPDSLEQSSQGHQSQQPEQEDDHDTMQEGFCYVVGTHALACQVTALLPDIAANSGINSSSKQIQCQHERDKNVIDDCILCGAGAETLLQEEVLAPLQHDLHQAEAALQTGIKGDGSSEGDACESSTQQGTSSLSAEAHAAGLCKAVPEASQRQDWGSSESDMAASAELLQVRRSGNKRKRQDDRADHKLQAPCKRRQGADGLPWSQFCRNLASNICFIVLAVWLGFDILD